MDSDVTIGEDLENDSSGLSTWNGVYAELPREGRSDGRPMSPATVQRVHGGLPRGR